MSSRSAKSIFITGAASGIGRATALRFAGKGWYVGLFDLDEDGLEKLREEIGGDQACSQFLDVTDSHSVDKALSFFATNTDGKIDLLFNCAGILRTGEFETVPLEAQLKIIEVNAMGVVNCCHQALPYLRKSDNACVVNVGSASGIYGVPGFATYSASKHFVRGLTEALSIEWQRHGIRVVDVMPPFVRTAMVAENPHPIVDRLGVNLVPEDVAAEVEKAAGGQGPHYVMGASIRLMDAVQRLLPQGLRRAFMKSVVGY